MGRSVAARDRPTPSIALVMNVADWKGIWLVHSLAEAGLGVAIHFTANRQAVDWLVQDIWDRGGRVCALDGAGANETDREALLSAARSILGHVHVIIDASTMRRDAHAAPAPVTTASRTVRPRRP